MAAIRLMQSQATPDSSPTSISEPLTEMPVEEPLFDVYELFEEEELLAAADSRVVINLLPKLSLSVAERNKLDEDPVLSRIQGSHYYELDESGVLLLPGLPDIVLLGMNDEQIMQRLGAEPSLEGFDVSAVLLNTEQIGIEALKLFGHDLFASNELGFDPPMAGPVPSDYVLASCTGPADPAL